MSEHDNDSEPSNKPLDTEQHDVPQTTDEPAESIEPKSPFEVEDDGSENVDEEQPDTTEDIQEEEQIRGMSSTTVAVDEAAFDGPDGPDGDSTGGDVTGGEQADQQEEKDSGPAYGTVPDEEEYLDPIKQNVTVEKEFQEALDKGVRVNTDLYLGLLNHTEEEFNRLTENMEVPQVPANEQERVWGRAMVDGIRNLQHANALTRSLSRATSAWAQVVEQDGQRLGFGRPRIGSGDGTNKLTGDRAKYHILGALGLGSVIQVPLWHSGIWVSMKRPSNSDLLLLEEIISQIKVEIGADTSGQIYSNSMVYTVSALMDFIFEHVFHVTVKDAGKEELRELILCQDIPILVWGMACCIHPEGYPYRRPCIADPNECRHVIEAKLNLTRLHFTDKASLTNAQKRHMVNRKATHSVEAVKNYQAAHTQIEKREIRVAPTVGIVLRAPSLNDYIQAGFNWVEGITEMVEKSFGSSLRGEDRTNAIVAHGRITKMREYSHWVDQINSYTGEDDDEVKYVEDRDTIHEVMDELSAEENIMERFTEGVSQYIDDTTISLIGIPRYKCPSCGKPQPNEDSPHPYIIPIDVIMTFFTLRRQPIIQATS